VPLNREDRILLTRYGYGIARLRDDVHLHIAAVQIGDELHCDSTKSDLRGEPFIANLLPFENRG
jgi:hypothetical protein